MEDNKPPKGHYIDGAWYLAVTNLGKQAIEYLLPDLYKDMAPGKEPQILGERLPRIEAGADLGGTIADTCFLVPISSGPSRVVSVILEQQHQDDKNIGQRVFREFYRLMDRQGGDVTAVVIFTGPSDEVIDEYLYSFQGTSLSFKFNACHVKSQDVESLKRDERLFALVVLAGLYSLRAKDDPRQREIHARELVEILRKGNYPSASDREKRSLLLFLDQILKLEDKDISLEFRKEFKMELMTLTEVQDHFLIQEGKREGMIEGEIKGKLEAARNMLADGVPIETIARYVGLPEADLRMRLGKPGDAE